MKNRPTPGFTLIELLASISVLLILVVVTSQLISAVSSVLRTGKARIDIFTQARTTFGALDRDVRQMVLRPDLAAFTDATGNNNSFAFYTCVQGGEGNRAVSLVEYRIDNQTTAPQLSRRDYGMDFNTLNPPRVLTLGDSTDLKDLSNSKVESKVLAQNVIRFNWQFIDATGTAGDHFVYNYSAPSATTNTQVVQLSLLVLDADSYNLLIQSGQISALLSSTIGPPDPGESFGQYWQRQIDSGSLLGVVPRPVLKSIRVFERSIVVPLSQ